MEIDRDFERFGALQDRPKELVVQIAAACVAIDECALEALLADPAIQIGKEAKAAKRLGLFFTTSARKSFDSRAIATCSATSACSTPGAFSESTCMSIPAASIAAMRPSPTS